MTPKQIHAEMAQVLDAPGYPLLAFYRDADFETADRRYLEVAWHAEARMLWIVRGNGTHLVPLDLHERLAEDARSIAAMEGPKDFFLLTNKGVAKLSQPKALAEAARVSWRTERDGGVFKGVGSGSPRRVADIVEITHPVERKPLPREAWERPEDPPRMGDRQVSVVKLYPRLDPQALSLGDLIALRVHSERAAIESSGTLMMPTRAVKLGAHDLDALMERQRSAWMREEARAKRRAPRAPDAELSM